MHILGVIKILNLQYKPFREKMVVKHLWLTTTWNISLISSEGSRISYLYSRFISILFFSSNLIFKRLIYWYECYSCWIFNLFSVDFVESTDQEACHYLYIGFCNWDDVIFIFPVRIVVMEICAVYDCCASV